jgi:hypothetical protein
LKTFGAERPIELIEPAFSPVPVIQDFSFADIRRQQESVVARNRRMRLLKIYHRPHPVLSKNWNMLAFEQDSRFRA